MTDQSTPVPPPPYPSAATQHGQSYLPGMGLDWLLPLYDTLTRALGMASAHRD